MKKILIILGLLICTIAFAQSIDYPVQELDNCQDREDCRQYCDALSNTEDCLNFAEAHQLFTSTELREARKVVNALKQGAQTPGNCQNKTECDAYCNQREHIRECFNFAKKIGLIPPGEMEQAEKSIPLIEKGESPGSCVGKEECDAYCSVDEHKEECMNFAVKAGLMSQEEAETYKRTGGKGPGDCQSKEECDAFCNNPENQQTCFQFGVEHGLVSQEEIDMIESETQKMRDELQSAPPEVISCLNEKLGSDMVEKLKSGTASVSSKTDNVVRSCFEEYYPQQEPQEQQEGGYAPGTAPGEQPLPPEGELPPPEGEMGPFPERQMSPEGEMMKPQESPQGKQMPPEDEMAPPEKEMDLQEVEGE